MKLRIYSGLFSTIALATACSSGPDLDQLRQDFDHPTGSVHDQHGLIAATGQREASGPALALMGGGFADQGLTATGSDLGALAPLRLHGRHLAQLQRRLAPTGRAIAALESFPGDDSYANECADAPEAQAAYERASQQLLASAAGGSTSASATAEYTIDVGACSGGRMTGALEVALELHVEATSGQVAAMSFRIDETFHDVCEVAGDQRCVDGAFVIEASMKTGDEGAGDLQMLAGWELSSSWLDGTTRRAADLKGGVRTRLASSGTSGSVVVEYLVYVRDGSGDEVSYVLSISADADGQGAISYRGADGTLECQVSADGAGTCTATNGAGTETIRWTADEYAQASRG